MVVGAVGFPVNLVFGAEEHIKRYDFAYTGADEKGNPVETWRGPGVHKKDDQQQLVEKDRFRQQPADHAVFRRHIGAGRHYNDL